jgi:Phosphodiester glycosidase
MDTLETRTDAEVPRPPASEPKGARRRHRVRRVVLLVLLLLLPPVGWSYAQALRAPGSAPLSARTIEWIKEHHGGPAVIWVEKVWYSWHTPPVGGQPDGGIPVAQGHASQNPPPKRAKGPELPPHLPAPAPVVPIAAHPLPREGRWQAVGRTAHGLPTVRVTYLRPDSLHTSLLAGVMWMDTKLLRAHLIAGTQVPGSGSWPDGFKIPSSMYPRLDATFNSGFLLKDAHGGFYLDGKMASPLVRGQASLVVYMDGTVDLGTWGKEVRMTPDVTAVRQNLWLLVDHGKPNPSLASDPNLTWGATFSGGILVWRSGVGVTRDGALVYVDGPGLSASSLADLLIHAGAVRAMELDINHVWDNFISYREPGARGYANLLSGMARPPDRYLTPDDRDFFAVYLR